MQKSNPHPCFKQQQTDHLAKSTKYSLVSNAIPHLASRVGLTFVLVFLVTVFVNAICDAMKRKLIFNSRLKKKNTDYRINVIIKEYCYGMDS